MFWEDATWSLISLGQLLDFLRKIIRACYLQSGIQTQWNIWDGIFYKNSWRTAPLNNFRKKLHLIFYLRGSEFDSDLEHQTRNTYTY